MPSQGRWFQRTRRRAVAGRFVGPCPRFALPSILRVRIRSRRLAYPGTRTAVPCPIPPALPRTASDWPTSALVCEDRGGTNGGYRGVGPDGDDALVATPTVRASHGAPNDVMTTQNGRAFN